MGSKFSSKGNESAQRKVVPSQTSWFVLALLPVPFLFLASYLLKSTISSPPASFGSGSMFDKIAPRYDFINRALALNLDMSWRHRLVKEVVGPNGKLFYNSGVKILDLATGTADVAILLGKAAERYSSAKAKDVVLGLDPSQNMLNVGKTKIDNAHLSSIITLKVGDARKLDLESNSFDAATMSFGIRNVPEKDSALCEIHRVLKKGESTDSKLAIMEFSEPDENSGVMGSLARVFIRHVVPSLGALLSGAPKEYMHLQKSINEFPSPKEFVQLMEGLKCAVWNEESKELAIDTFGSFRVTEVVNLNFGSVQIYVANPILKQLVTE
ncbi:hypothetical protein HJC23_012686 [Cyclotella cryptica]|uniref:2-methoxy-6-polyprenyl-1,4-benzoquinol methylase, mitochondrial n=1 Tax=Cyclotella cryptica TaxID=29204 RepID=A0ABD3PMN1_9STRA|eukprot:CCRYP_013321-RA/>CCRYP_013321-RA protein AED:0.00 eAED:0.00 QI:213/-1/1/1/-1/1/1/185/325